MSESGRAMRDRPDSLPTDAYRVETAHGKVYVRMTYLVDDGDRGEMFEVFINKGESGGFVQSWCEALGIAISIGLRSGADARDLASYLMCIRDGRVQEDNGDRIQSIPDATAVAMMRSLEGTTESIRDECEDITDFSFMDGSYEPEEWSDQ